MAKRGRTPTIYPIEEMAKYYINGHTMGEVCDKFSLCRTTLMRRFTKHGIPFGYPRNREDFIKSIDTKSNDCVEWPYGKTKGYGVFRARNKTFLAHRYSYEFHNGKIPDGQLVMHSCDNPCCVNPNHLSAGTMQDNMNDMMHRERCGTSKLNNEKAKKIKILIKKGKSDYEIAKIFSVCHATIRCMRFGKTWKHIKI
jgi:hypothetical protein